MKSVVMLTRINEDLSAIRTELREIRRMFESEQHRENRIEGGIRHE